MNIYLRKSIYNFYLYINYAIFGTNNRKQALFFSENNISNLEKNIVMNKIIYVTKVLSLVFAGLLLSNTMVLATETGNYQALFIAVDNYNSKVWTPLNNPVNDATAIKSVLQSRYGFSKISMLYNQDATRAKILETLEDQVSKLSVNDNFVIYFSGHGIEIGEEGYWVPVEAKSQERYELLSTTEIKNVISKSECKHILIMVDACFSSTIFKSSAMSSINDGTGSYYEQVDQLISRQAITAGGLEPVPDGSGGNSVFAKYVLKFLINNQKQVIDAGELYELIKYPVAANSPSTPQFGHLQNTGHEGGQFLFRLKEEKLCDSPVYFEEGEVVKFTEEGGVLHAKTSFKNIKYQWSYNSMPLDFTGANLPIKKSGMYGVTIITEDGDCSNSAIAEVEIVMPEIIIDVLEGHNVEFTHKGILNATITGYTDKVIYEWKKGNFVISNQSSVEVTESDNYTVIIKLADGRELGRKTSLVTIKNRIYTVQLGDNVERIARNFYNDANKTDLIYTANPNLKRGDVLRVGSDIIIPTLGENSEEATTKVGAIESFSPFSSPTNYNGGMITDIVSAVYKGMGKKTEISYIPNNQLRGVTFNGRIEMSYPLTRNKSDEMLFLFSEPLYTTLTVFFANKDSEVNDMEDTMEKRMKKGKFTKLVVALPVGFTSDKLLEYYEKKYIVLKPMPTLEACFKAMQAGEVDLVAAPQVAGLVSIQSAIDLNRSDFKILDKSIESTTLHLVVSKEHPQAESIIKEFNAGLKKAKDAGTISTIVDKHIDLIQKAKP